LEKIVDQAAGWRNQDYMDPKLHSGIRILYDVCDKVGDKVTNDGDGMLFFSTT
jgi:hypothetical protein